MCRNLDRLVAWASHPDQSACHKHLTDYYPLKNKIETYAYCPENSPYRAKSEAYFAKWSHKDKYAELTYEDVQAMEAQT